MAKNMNSGWIGVDLDGTLAFHDGTWKSPEDIGEPIPLMVKRVKQWLKDGVEVKIFTARAAPNSPERDRCVKAVNEWVKKHIGQELEITAVKDYKMIKLYDDRAVQVVPNTGITLESLLSKGDK